MQGEHLSAHSTTSMNSVQLSKTTEISEWYSRSAPPGRGSAAFWAADELSTKMWSTRGSCTVARILDTRLSFKASWIWSSFRNVCVCVCSHVCRPWKLTVTDCRINRRELTFRIQESWSWWRVLDGLRKCLNKGRAPSISSTLLHVTVSTRQLWFGFMIAELQMEVWVCCLLFVSDDHWLLRIRYVRVFELDIPPKSNLLVQIVYRNFDASASSLI